VAPYEAMIRSEGGDPFSAMDNLFRTAVALRTAPPGMKAQAVANLIKQYGVDIQALDNHLSGQAQPERAGQGEYRDPRVDSLMAQLQAREQAERAHRAQEARTALAEVEVLEFFDDVREDMADLVEVAARRGVALSPKDAYNRACSMNPEVSKVIAQRDAAKRAANPNGSTSRVQAASSVRASPPTLPNGATSAGTMRDDIEEAIAQLRGR
jgi:hypothetical protein